MIKIIIIGSNAEGKEISKGFLHVVGDNLSFIEPVIRFHKGKTYLQSHSGGALVVPQEVTSLKLFHPADLKKSLAHIVIGRFLSTREGLQREKIQYKKNVQNISQMDFSLEVRKKETETLMRKAKRFSSSLKSWKVK